MAVPWEAPANSPGLVCQRIEEGMMGGDNRVCLMRVCPGSWGHLPLGPLMGAVHAGERAWLWELSECVLEREPPCP